MRPFVFAVCAALICGALAAQPPESPDFPPPRPDPSTVADCDPDDVLAWCQQHIEGVWESHYHWCYDMQLCAAAGCPPQYGGPAGPLLPTLIPIFVDPFAECWDAPMMSVALEWMGFTAPQARALYLATLAGDEEAAP